MKPFLLLVVGTALASAGCQMPSRDSRPAPSVAPASKEPGAAPASATGNARRDEARPAASKPTPTPPRAPSAPAKVGEGTVLSLVLETTASSDKSTPGDEVKARLTADLTDGARVLVPAGAELRGEVLTAQGAGRVKGRARLAVAFMKITVAGKSYDIQTSPIDVTAAAQKGRDAKIVGGGAAAGALIGAIAGGGKGAAKGAVIGGAAGGGTVLATKGKEVVFAAGSRRKVTLRTSLTLD
jgi:hypothetical protein